MRVSYIFYYISFDVVKRAPHFLARIEEVQGVENFLGQLKERDHLGAEEHWQIRRADNAVVVLAGRGAARLDNELVDLGCELEDDFTIFFFREVHQGEDMDIAVADVPRDRVDHVRLVFVEERGEFRQEVRVAGGRHDEVVDEGRRNEAVEILAQEGE